MPLGTQFYNFQPYTDPLYGEYITNLLPTAKISAGIAIISMLHGYSIQCSRPNCTSSFLSNNCMGLLLVTENVARFLCCRKTLQHNT